MSLKNALFTAFFLLLTGTLAACSSSSSTPVMTATPVSAPVPSGATVKAHPSPSSSVSSVVVVATRQVDGFPRSVPKVTVLTTVQGLTLYIHERREVSSFNCSGTCARIWHPLIFRGSGRPASTTPLPGTLSVETDKEGQKVVLYQGYPLFTYSGDTVPGQVKGREGGDTLWRVADIMLSPGL